jgi:hypothetical protein
MAVSRRQQADEPKDHGFATTDNGPQGDGRRQMAVTERKGHGTKGKTIHRRDAEYAELRRREKFIFKPQISLFLPSAPRRFDFPN